MKTLPQRSLLNEITRVTQMMYKEFPELYTHLLETPVTTTCDIKELGMSELNEYLESLEMQWKTYCRVHRTSRFISDSSYLRHYIQLIHHHEDSD